MFPRAFAKIHCLTYQTVPIRRALGKVCERPEKGWFFDGRVLERKTPLALETSGLQGGSARTTSRSSARRVMSLVQI